MVDIFVLVIFNIRNLFYLRPQKIQSYDLNRWLNLDIDLIQIGSIFFFKMIRVHWGWWMMIASKFANFPLNKSTWWVFYPSTKYQFIIKKIYSLLKGTSRSCPIHIAVGQLGFSFPGRIMSDWHFPSRQTVGTFHGRSPGHRGSPFLPFSSADAAAAAATAAPARPHLLLRNSSDYHNFFGPLPSGALLR